jgi:hypothetical protein
LEEHPDHGGGRADVRQHAGLGWNTSNLLLGGSVSVVPGPASLVLFGIGGLMPAGRKRRGREAIALLTCGCIQTVSEEGCPNHGH